MALPVGLAPTLFPQTTGRFSVQLREHNRKSKIESRKSKWWEVLVTLQFVASGLI